MLCIGIRTIHVHVPQFYYCLYIYAIVCICKYIGMCTLGKGSLFLSRSLSLSSQTSHTHTQIRCRSKYHALLHAHTLECILSCRRAARHTCKHLSKTVAVIRRIQVHMSVCTHVHAYVARVCDEMGLFLSHRLAHIHMYVFGAEEERCMQVCRGCDCF